MKDFPIPLVAFGRGSQPTDADFEYTPMPAPEPLPRPNPPEGAARRDRLLAAEVIGRLLASGGLASCRGKQVAVASLERGARGVLDESLGQGEVSAIVNEPDGSTWHVQESAFCGVWRVQRVHNGRGIVHDCVEVNDMPEAVKAGARRAAAAVIDAGALPQGVMNAPMVLHEIGEQARRWQQGSPAHVVNLSHLPFNEADHAALESALGWGGVRILSRGFGNCRIANTGVPRVWRVQYYNSMSTLILDTLEVVDIPEAAVATDDDFAEGQERLAQLAEWLREP